MQANGGNDAGNIIFKSPNQSNQNARRTMISLLQYRLVKGLIRNI